VEKIFFFLGTFDKHEKLSAKLLQNEAIISNEIFWWFAEII